MNLPLRPKRLNWATESIQAQVQSIGNDHRLYRQRQIFVEQPSDAWKMMARCSRPPRRSRDVDACLHITYDHWQVRNTRIYHLFRDDLTYNSGARNSIVMELQCKLF